MDDHNIIVEDTIKPEEFLPLLREALQPLNVCLSVLIRSGSRDLLTDVHRVLAGLMAEAETQFEMINDRHGGIH